MSNKDDFKDDFKCYFHLVTSAVCSKAEVKFEVVFCQIGTYYFRMKIEDYFSFSDSNVEAFCKVYYVTALPRVQGVRTQRLQDVNVFLTHNVNELYRLYKYSCI